MCVGFGGHGDHEQQHLELKDFCFGLIHNNHSISIYQEKKKKKHKIHNIFVVLNSNTYWKLIKEMKQKKAWAWVGYKKARTIFGNENKLVVENNYTYIWAICLKSFTGY